MAIFDSTAGTDKFKGGKADDSFYFWPGYMSAKDKVDGGGGDNWIVLANDSDAIWSVSKTEWPVFTNVLGIALLSRPNDWAEGFNLTLNNDVLSANKDSRVTIDATQLGRTYSSLQLNASSVTKVAFDILGSSGQFFENTGHEQASEDILRTGTQNDRFIYYANSLINDRIDGGAGTDTILLVGAGHAASKGTGNKTNPNGFSGLGNVKNIENVVITALAAGQTRTIDFGYTDEYKGKNVVFISTNRNYGTDKASSAVNGRLIVDASGVTSTGSFNIKGGNAGDILIGGRANDYLSGGKGDDILIGGSGSDTLYGGLGNDLFMGDDSYFTEYPGGYEIKASLGYRSGDDKMYGGAGNDTFQLSANYPLSNNDLISGGEGTDTLEIWGNFISDSNLDGAKVSGIEMIDIKDSWAELYVRQQFLKKNHDENGRLLIRDSERNLAGTLKIDASNLTDAQFAVHIVVRSPDKEFLVGGKGSDIFDYSLVNNKSMYSGLNTSDTITGGGGFDTILVSEGRTTTLGYKISGIEKLQVVNKSTTGDKTTIILGTKEAISIDGSKLGANDTLIAEGYYKAPKTGKLYEAIASLQITGGKGNDILSGGRANDRLIGGSGDDTLTGNKGSDKMTGGKGADHFVFASATDSLPATGARDFITDFHQSEADKIEFLHTGVAYSFIGSSPFQGKAGEVRSYMSGINTYVQLDEDGDGIADLGIGLSGKITLTQSDFIL